jgi:nucleotide-binding universal stress UspA family protein
LKKILVPIDFSDCSKKALLYAVSFARQFQAELVLLYVVPITYSYSEFGEAPVVDFPQLESDLKDKGKKDLAALGEKVLGEETPYKTVVRSGRPVTEILTAITELEVDLVILSTHGYTGSKHVFIGSTSENVVRRASCPVLVVREVEHEFVSGESGGSGESNG